MKTDAQPAVPENAESSGACLGCGQTKLELYADGQMGCARCYEKFTLEVERALKEIHGESRHLGKNSA